MFQFITITAKFEDTMLKSKVVIESTSYICTCGTEHPMKCTCHEVYKYIFDTFIKAHDMDCKMFLQKYIEKYRETAYNLYDDEVQEVLELEWAIENGGYTDWQCDFSPDFDPKQAKERLTFILMNVSYIDDVEIDIILSDEKGNEKCRHFIGGIEDFDYDAEEEEKETLKEETQKYLDDEYDEEHHDYDYTLYKNILRFKIITQQLI